MSTDANTYAAIAKTFILKPLEDSEVEITGEIPFDIVAPFKDKALERIAKEIEMPGFRKGNVPVSIAKTRVSGIAVLEDAVDMVMQALYPAVIEEHKVDAVGRPSVNITKLAEGNPVGITINVAIYPEVVLPKNWKTLGEGVEEKAPDAVDDDEVEKTIVQLQESRRVKPSDSTLSDVDTEKAQDGTDSPAGELPALDDAFAKSLGAFENMDALRTQIKQGITEEKARAAKDARRATIVDKLLEGVEVSVPKIFVESELEKIIAQMREDVSRFGMTFEDYLARTQKTEEMIRSEFRDQAAKRARLQITLNKIAGEEKIEVEKEEVEKELKHAIEHFPEANPELVRVHIESVMRNEKSLQLLEAAGKKAQ